MRSTGFLHFKKYYTKTALLPKVFFSSKAFCFLCIVFISTSIFSATAWDSFADHDWQISEEMSDAEEIELGKQVDDYIRHQFYLENDPELNRAVSNIMQRLVTVSDRNTLPFTSTVLQSYSVNAFSAPGGHIYVTYGLLKFAQTEDEVAGIIGHEVAHASLRHASKLYHEVMEMLSHQDKGMNSAADLLLLNSHLEEFEQDADTRGVFYAYKAGFSPCGLLNFLERHLNLIIRKRMFGILGFSSTVTINARINHLREYIATLQKEE